MKHKHVLTAFVILMLAMAPTVYAACTNATLAGTLGFTTTGTLFLPGGPVTGTPVAAVGSGTFDLNGNFTGSQDRSVGGAFAHETITGKSTVSPNCTFTLDAEVFDSNNNLVRKATIQGVLVDNGKQSRSIFESVVLVLPPNGVEVPVPSALTIEATRL